MLAFEYARSVFKHCGFVSKIARVGSEIFILLNTNDPTIKMLDVLDDAALNLWELYGITLYWFELENEEDMKLCMRVY